nr:hypothetical protein [Streptosporangium pseudovulgare]
MPEADVVDVEQDLVLALAVPHLVAGVAGVGEDGPYRALGPGDADAVPVASGVVRRRAGDAVAGEALGDGEQAVAVQELGEDPGHHGRGHGVELQPVQPSAVGCLGRVGVRARVAQAVAVRWPPAEEAALHLGLRRHGAAHPDLDPVALALAHPAEDAHHQVVRLVGRVDRPADLRHPQRHPEVLEDREGQAVLVAVERPMRLADHHGLEPAARVAQLGQQGRGPRTPLPGDRAGLVDVEELGDDLPAPRLDQRPGPGDLPGP